jgi:tetratricopeptide (TPR) repeat protein
VYLLSALAEVFLGRGDMAKGRSYAERAVALAEVTPGISAARLGGAYRVQGAAHLENGDIQAAISAYQRAAELFENAVPPDWDQLASTLNDLGAACNDLMDGSCAERYYRRAIGIYEGGELNDPESHSSTLSNLSVLYTNEGRFEEAERLLVRTSELLAIAGVGGAKRAVAIGNRASLLVRLGRFDDAEPQYREAIALLERSLGAEHPDTVMMMTSLGYFYLRSSQIEEGVRLMSTALARAVNVLESDHPLMAYVQNVAGGVYCEAGNTSDGIPLLQASLATRLASFGDGHWTVASGRSLLGGCFARTGQRDEAEPLLKAGHAALAEMLGPDDERTRVAASRLVDFYRP